MDWMDGKMHIKRRCSNLGDSAGGQYLAGDSLCIVAPPPDDADAGPQEGHVCVAACMVPVIVRAQYVGELRDPLALCGLVYGTSVCDSDIASASMPLFVVALGRLTKAVRRRL